jgi:hypothetical protein
MLPADRQCVPVVRSVDGVRYTLSSLVENCIGTGPRRSIGARVTVNCKAAPSRNTEILTALPTAPRVSEEIWLMS